MPPPPRGLRATLLAAAPAAAQAPAPEHGAYHAAFSENGPDALAWEGAALPAGVYLVEARGEDGAPRARPFHVAR